MNGPIIAATDFSSRADRAVDRAIMLGKELSFDVDLLHVIEYAPAQTVDVKALDRKMRQIMPEGADLPVRFVYPQGAVPAAIAEHAEEVDAPMIVIGVARHNSIGDYILGTAVDRVIRGTSVPVLVVKNRPRKPYGKVLLATDFSEPSKRAIEWAAATFPEAELHLLHAYHVPFGAWNQAPYVAEEMEKEAGERLAAMVREMPEELAQRFTVHVRKGNLCAAVNALIEEAGIDLVALGSQGESGFRHATIGSQASAVLENAKADTVVIAPRVA